MPQSAYVTGPIPIFVAFRVNGQLGAPELLGTGETATEPDIRAQWDGVMNDITGTKLPYDVAYEGEEAFFSVQLTRWDDLVRKKLAARPFRQGSVAGVNAVRQAGPGNTYGDRGSLMITEGLAVACWLPFLYAKKPVYSAANLIRGYRFPYCWTEGPETWRGGTRAARVALTFHAIAGFESNNLRLYDHDMSAVENLTLA